MDDFETLAVVGLELERAGKDAEAIDYFHKLVEQFPDDPRAHFEYGGAFDSAGQESEAVPHYRRAIALGLSGDYLPRAYLQLGSSLRNIGAFDEAVATLDEGCRQFPDHVALRVFHVFALESAGRGRDALTDMLELAILHIHTSDMLHYARAIRYYTDERAR